MVVMDMIGANFRYGGQDVGLTSRDFNCSCRFEGQPTSRGKSVRVILHFVNWAFAICPDGTNSNDNGDTCEFNL